jgi:hypothetical protein
MSVPTPTAQFTEQGTRHSVPKSSALTISTPQRPRTPLAAWYEADGTEIPVDQVDMTMGDDQEEQPGMMEPPAHVNQMPSQEEFDGPKENFVDMTTGTPMCHCGYPMGRFMVAPRKHLWKCRMIFGCDLKVWEVSLLEYVMVSETHFQSIDAEL